MTLPIDVLLVTWPNHPKRIEYFRRTLEALLKNLIASSSGHELRYICSAEAEQDPACPWCGDDLIAVCAEYKIPLHWHEPPASLGAGMNAAIKLATAPVYLLCQDDFLLLEPLDISPGVELMLARPDVDMIRYSYYLHPANGTKFKGKIDGWQQVDLHGTWPYGDDPQLRRQDFTAKFGWYLEGGDHGRSEGDMLHRLKRKNATIVADDRCYFAHIGSVAAVPESVEKRERAEHR